MSYLDLMEVNQGSPLVGSLYINGQVIIKEQGFGGPLLYFNRKIYIPVLFKKKPYYEMTETKIKLK